ncbi:MAG TPA: ferritin-like domain-containing protein [Pseudomonadales bacterium]
MEKATQIGGNRTGMDTSPLMAKEMLTGAALYEPTQLDPEAAYAALQGQYMRPDNNVGSMPPPGTMKGQLKTVAGKMRGRNPEVLLNKLGERLAYERTGVRLYEAFIRKCEALPDSASLVPLVDLREIRADEEAHFMLLQEAIIQMGADPTAQTPDADVSGVASQGYMQVLTDPRTSIVQSLEMLMSIELIDNAAWELLMTLADEMGLDILSAAFEKAWQQEETHLQRVRMWYERGIRNELMPAAATK